MHAYMEMKCMPYTATNNYVMQVLYIIKGKSPKHNNTLNNISFIALMHNGTCNILLSFS